MVPLPGWLNMASSEKRRPRVLRAGPLAMSDSPTAEAPRGLQPEGGLGPSTTGLSVHGELGNVRRHSDILVDGEGVGPDLEGSGLTTPGGPSHHTPWAHHAHTGASTVYFSQQSPEELLLNPYLLRWPPVLCTGSSSPCPNLSRSILSLPDRLTLGPVTPAPWNLHLGAWCWEWSGQAGPRPGPRDPSP